MKDHNEVMGRLHNSGFDVWIVGGWVRDRLMGREPKDPDLATTATPDQIVGLFLRAHFASALFHSVVYVHTDAGMVEVATLRLESGYSDSRRPDEVKYTCSIEEDLARRDFTVNAMALDYEGNLVDPFGGVIDIKNGILRAVGTARDRLTEHPTRMLRAVRFAAGHELQYDDELMAALIGCHTLSSQIPWESVRDELMKGLDTDWPGIYLEHLRQLGLLGYFLPEINALVGVTQNIHHDFDTVFQHTREALQQAERGLVRVGVLFHDVGKAVTAEFKSEEYGYSFIAHEKEGVEVARRALQRLCFTNKEIKLVLAAVRWHMPNICSARAARRFLVNTGDEETARFVLAVMKADGHGRRGTDAGRLLVERALEEQKVFTARDLKVSGKDVMEILGLAQGKEVGFVLNFLVELVTRCPEANTRLSLVDVLKKLGKIIPKGDNGA